MVARRIEEVVEIFTQSHGRVATGTAAHVLLESFPLAMVAHHLFAAAAAAIAARCAGRRRGCCPRVEVAATAGRRTAQCGCHAGIFYFFGEIHDALGRHILGRQQQGEPRDFAQIMNVLALVIAAH